jgi:hypothetical protein
MSTTTKTLARTSSEWGIRMKQNLMWIENRLAPRRHAARPRSFVRSFVSLRQIRSVSVARARSIQLGMSLIGTNLVLVPSGILTEESAQQGLGPMQHVPLAGKRIRPVTLFTLTRYAYLAQEKNPTP